MKQDRITNQNLTNIHTNKFGTRVGYHRKTKRWFFYHTDSSYGPNWLPY